MPTPTNNFKLGQLPAASLPYLGTDLFLISRNGDQSLKGTLNGLAALLGAASDRMLTALYDPTNIGQNVYARQFHTGTQLVNTISDFNTASDVRSDARIELQKGAANGVAPLNVASRIPRPFTDNSLRVSVPTFRIVGDSIASQNVPVSHAVSGATSMAITFYPYWWNLVVWLSGNQINNVGFLNVSDNKRYGTNSGIGGSDMVEVAAFLPAIIDTMPENHIIFCVGTNDINNGTSLATLNNRFETLNSMAVAAGIVPIWTTVLPRNAVDGANDWSATVTTTAQKRLIMNAHNIYRKAFCKENGIICVDWNAVFSNSTGDAATGYTVDGVHPGGKGSWYLGLKFWNDISGLFPNGSTVSNAYDVYDVTYNPFGNRLNGAFIGTAGVTSVGSGTGTITGTVPTNFQFAKATSTTTNAFLEIIDGELEITFTSFGTGNVSENWRLNYWSGSSTSLGSYAVINDYLEMSVEVQYVKGHGGTGKAVGARVGNSAAVTNAGSTISFVASPPQILDSANGFGSFVGSRLAVVTGSNATNNTVYKIVSAAAGALTLDPTSVVVTAAAGPAISVSIPSMSTNSLGASLTTIPDENTPVIYQRTPVMQMPYTGNVVPRIDIYVNGTIAGTHKVRIARPALRKLPFAPSLINFEADDD